MPAHPRRHLRRATALAASVLLAAGLAVTLGTATSTAADAPVTAAAPSLPVGHTGTWLTDASGRVVVVHGVNQVFKVPPYEPAAAGFGDDDAAFLADNGFNVVRVGVIWAGVEPQPGSYDDAYLDSVAETVDTLAAHGIMSVLDFHQDLYNEKFQGEGAPAWAVLDHGRPNPSNGFPGNYFANYAEEAAWDSFWKNAPAADGVGLQDHYAAAWAHVAARFGDDPDVLGYELMNEPWPGTVWEPCALPILGCPLFDRTLTAFYQRVTDAIRTVDPTTTVWIEPNVLFSTVDSTRVGTVHDANVGWAFHDYCPIEAELHRNVGCSTLDRLTVAFAKRYSTQHRVPWLLTEFGATGDLANLAEMVSLADASKLGWMEWAYTGNDKTSASPNGQALVLDPSRPPTGSNVVTAKLKVLAEPYPQVIAGTPQAWSFHDGVFTLTYSTAKVGGGTFPVGSVTSIAAPAIQFPNGYGVSVTGGTVVSAPSAATLQIASVAGAKTVTVTVSGP